MPHCREIATCCRVGRGGSESRTRTEQARSNRRALLLHGEQQTSCNGSSFPSKQKTNSRPRPDENKAGKEQSAERTTVERTQREHPHCSVLLAPPPLSTPPASPSAISKCGSRASSVRSHLRPYKSFVSTDPLFTATDNFASRSRRERISHFCDWCSFVDPKTIA